MSSKDIIHILIVEDDLYQQRILLEFFADNAEYIYKVAGAESLDKAINLLNKDFYHLILLDLSLPDSNGLDAIFKLRKDYPKVSIIVITEDSTDETESKYIINGAQEYLVKGYYSKEDLFSSIRHTLTKRLQITDLERERDELSQVIDETDKEAILMELRKVGHDINNVVASLFGYCTLLPQFKSKEKTDSQTYLRIVYSNANKLLSIAKQLSIKVKDLQAQEGLSNNTPHQLELVKYLTTIEFQYKQIVDDISNAINNHSKLPNLDEKTIRYQNRILYLVNKLYSYRKKLKLTLK